jgi:hypothetical protein
MIVSEPIRTIRAWPAARASDQGLTLEGRTDAIRQLIWVYLVLWLVEGGLRRWFLPGLADPLLLIRDPVVLAIYCLAFIKNLFPVNGFIYSGLALAALCILNALAFGHGNAIVALYGVRCDFLHIPLIFIMGRTLTRKDLLALAKIGVLLAVPYTALLVDQFYSPQSAWVNRGVGDDSVGAGFSGAMGRFRPPGTFSFITGVGQLYPLLAACWFVLVLTPRLPAWLMISSGVAILVAIPVSVSRILFLSVAIVAIVGVGALLAGGRLSVQVLFRAVMAAIILPLLAVQLPVFQDGMQAFSARWQDATTDNGGFQVAIVDRVIYDLISPFEGVEGTGLGTGFSTHVGQKLLTETVGFGASEGEWGRLLYDNGFLLGSLLVLYRMALAGAIVIAALRAWRHRSPEALIFASAAVLLLLNGQWSQSTTLGSAIICGGFALAAANNFKTGRATSAGTS